MKADSVKVTVVIPTRGDVDLQPVIDSLPPAWEIVIWDNGERMVTRSDGFAEVCTDLSVYGRYAAIEYATSAVCFTQDDDVIISDPEAIVREWMIQSALLPGIGQYQGIVANQPQEFRHAGYTDSCLVGFGACFHRDAPARAFERFENFGSISVLHEIPKYAEFFHRTCDIVFTTLTPSVLVDVPRTNLPYATDENRMYRQPDHVGERARMLELARRVRDG